jgi:hypothetical protein
MTAAGKAFSFFLPPAGRQKEKLASFIRSTYNTLFDSVPLDSFLF